MNRRTKIIVSVSGIFIVLLALLGLTYAYFLTRINGNTNDKSISVSTAKLELTYSDNSSEVLGSGVLLQPSNEPIGTKTFTVTNNGGDTNYSVVLENMSITNASDNTDTEFESNDFRYTLTCRTKSGSSCTNETIEETEFPLSNKKLINNDIAAHDLHTYTLTLWYLETGYDQSEDMNKSISAKINIIDPNKDNPYVSNKNLLAYNIINNAAIEKNNTELTENPITIPGKATPPWRYGKQEDPTTFTLSRTEATEYYISYADDYSVDKYGGGFTLGTKKSPVTTIKYSTDINPSDLAGKYAFWSTNEATARDVEYLRNIYKITTNEADITGTEIKYARMLSTSTAARKSREKELLKAEDDYGDSYYYRGGVEDNYLEMNNICFRIVRIQGDGSIKLTLAKEGACSSITTADTKSALINNGATDTVYGYTEETVDNTKTYHFNYEGYTAEDGLYNRLTSWYTSKFSDSKWNSILKNDLWCLGGKTTRYEMYTDKLLEADSTQKSYSFETNNRLMNRHEASYKCSNEADKVTGYIGALTADEAVYAGASTNYQSSNHYYLYDNAQAIYWLLSQASYCSVEAGCEYNRDHSSIVWSSGYLNAMAVYYANVGTRPALTLKAGTILDSGDGTKTNPYKIVEN